MEVAPFFVDFHHFLSIFTIFYRFSRFTHFCRDLHFVAIYALFPQFFLAKIAISATSHVFCMYAVGIIFIIKIFSRQQKRATDLITIAIFMTITLVLGAVLQVYDGVVGTILIVETDMRPASEGGD